MFLRRAGRFGSRGASRKNSACLPFLPAHERRYNPGMSANSMLVLQSVGIAVQLINAQIATVTHNSTVALIVGAVAGSFQYYLQHTGNRLFPPKG